MSDTHKNEILGLTVFLAVAGVSLVVTSVASDHWVNSKFEGNSTSNRTQGARVSFGLFNGEGNINFGLSLRQRKLELKCDLSEIVCGYIDPTRGGFEEQIQQYKNGTKNLEECALFGFALFATNLVTLSLSIVFGLLVIGFAIFNVFGRPIESITGVAGLYLWNAFALIFVLIGISVYMGLFYTQLTDMIPYLEMFGNDKPLDWPGDTKLDWSFFCVIGAAGTYVINILLLFVLGKNCACNYMASGEKEVQNDVILY